MLAVSVYTMSFDRQEIENEIIELELRLQKARGRLQDLQQDTLQESCLTYSMPPHNHNCCMYSTDMRRQFSIISLYPLSSTGL